VGERLRILDFVFAAVAQVTDHVVISSNDPLARRWIPGVQVLPDRHAGAGGLAGIEAALSWSAGSGGGSSHGRDIVAVAWDMPFVTGSLLASLVDAADANDADAVAPQSDSPHGIEPFCAFYSHRVREPLEAFLSAGGGAAHEFVKSLPRFQLLPTSHVARSGDPNRLLLSVNTPDDLVRARTLLAGAK
jgi:molybdopterin-guanine dinucleotide biosynthesis protein A